MAAGRGPLSIATSPPQCSIRPAKITFVLIIGQENTEIRDETSKNENRPSNSVTLYENSVNALRVRLDCGRENDDENNCSRIYHIHGFIDLNNDGKFDELENRIHHRSLFHNEKLQGTYDLELSIPAIDGINTKAGSNTVRLTLMLNEEWRKKCAKTDYTETREYKVNIIPKPICQSKDYFIIFSEKYIFICNEWYSTNCRIRQIYLFYECCKIQIGSYGW